MTSTFRSIPYPNLVDRVDLGNISLYEVSKIFQARSDIESATADFSCRVSKTNVFEHEITNSTSEKALGAMKNYFIYLSQDQSMFKQTFDVGVLTPLQGTKEKRMSETNASRHGVSSAQRSVIVNRNELEKTKKSLKKKESDLELTKAKVVACAQAVEEAVRQNAIKKSEKERENKFMKFISSFEATPEQEHQRQLKKVTRLNGEIDNLKLEIQVKKHGLLESIEHLDRQTEQAKVVFHEQEMARMTAYQQYLSYFCLLERTTIESRLSLLASLEAATREMNPSKDLASYVTEKPEEDVNTNSLPAGFAEFFAQPPHRDCCGADEELLGSVHQSSRALAILDWDYARRRPTKDTKPSVPGLGVYPMGSTIAATADRLGSSMVSSEQAQADTWRDSQPIAAANSLDSTQATSTNSTGGALALAPNGSEGVGKTTVEGRQSDPLTQALYSDNHAGSCEELGEFVAVSAPHSPLPVSHISQPQGKALPKWFMRDGTNKRSDSENSAVTPLHAQPPMTMMSSGDNDDFFYQFDYKDDANSGAIPLDTRSRDTHAHDGNEAARMPVRPSNSVNTASLEDRPGEWSDDNEDVGRSSIIGALPDLSSVTRISDYITDDSAPSPSKTDKAAGLTVGDVTAEDTHDDGDGAARAAALTRLLSEIFGEEYATSSTTVEESYESLSIVVPARTAMTESSASDSGQSTGGQKPSVLHTVEQWKAALSHRTEQDSFLQELDSNRGRLAGLHRTGYINMSMAMKAFLDHCYANSDVKAAMRLSNMTNTFYLSVSDDESIAPLTPEPFHVVSASKLKVVSSSNTIQGSESISSFGTDDCQDTSAPSTPATSSSSGKQPPATAKEKQQRRYERKYLQREHCIRNHEIWSMHGFWDTAMLMGIANQLDFREAVMWENSSDEELRDLVIDIHNHVFGQLGTIAFTMSGLGMSLEEVEKAILSLSQAAQLTEDLEMQLIHSIRAAHSTSLIMEGDDLVQVNPTKVVASEDPNDVVTL